MSVGGSLMEKLVLRSMASFLAVGEQPCSCQAQGGIQRALKGPDSLGLGACLSGFGAWWVTLGLVCCGLCRVPPFCSRPLVRLMSMSFSV